MTVYEADDCSGCEYKIKCTKAKGNRRMQLSKLFIKNRANSLQNITNTEGIFLRINRSIQIEDTFRVLKEDYGFKRFLTRGKNNAKIEFMLLVFDYNVNTLHNKIQNDRCGKSLYEIKIA